VFSSVTLFKRLPPRNGLHYYGPMGIQKGEMHIYLPPISAYLLWILCPHDASTSCDSPQGSNYHSICTQCGGGSKLNLLCCGCGTNKSSEVELERGHVLIHLSSFPFSPRGLVVRCTGQPTTWAILGYIEFNSTRLHFVWLAWLKKCRSTPKFKVRLVARLRPSD